MAPAPDGVRDPFAPDCADPLAALAADRARARAARDPNAELGWVATVDPDGAPAVRTLVLRELDGDWALFVSGTSPKWTHLSARPECQIAVWLPTVQRQWRLHAQVRPLERAILEHHWPRRPRTSQVMDHLYASLPQGSPVEHPDRLARAHAELDARLDDAPQAPAAALALGLDVQLVECVQIAPPPDLHGRRRWHRHAGSWQFRDLVP